MPILPWIKYLKKGFCTRAFYSLPSPIHHTSVQQSSWCMSFRNLNGLSLTVSARVYLKRANLTKREEPRSYKIVGSDGL